MSTKQQPTPQPKAESAALSSGPNAVTMVEPRSTALATNDGPLDFAADAGMGLEGVDKDSLAIPFIAVLQGLSPQLETVEGAKPGKFINTVTNELFDELRVIPVAFQRRFNRWVPREKGGGFKGVMEVSEVEALIAAGRTETDDRGQLRFEGDILKDTRNHFVLVMDDQGGWQPALMSLASTQIKRSKRWLAVINQLQTKDNAGRVVTPPSFASVFRVTTEKEANDQGSWYSFVIAREAWVESRALYDGAKGFHKQVLTGGVKVVPPSDDVIDAEGSDAQSGKF